MTNQFVITGFSPATGQLVEVIIVAESAAAAKVKGEEVGLEFVTARPHADDDAAGSGA